MQEDPTNEDPKGTGDAPTQDSPWTPLPSRLKLRGRNRPSGRVADEAGEKERPVDHPDQ